MNHQRPLQPGRCDGYDEVVYREALRKLELFPPIDRDDIHRAYRSHAKRIHPDRFLDQGEKDQATLRIQEINAAKEYTLSHFRLFEQRQARAHGPRPDGTARDGEETWAELLLLPITSVYALAMLVATGPLILLFRLAREDRRERWKASPSARRWVIAWRAWSVVGTHMAAIVLFAAVGEPTIKVWFGVSILVMAAADVASLVTGASNVLRAHRAVHRLQGLVRPA
jgi:hypothetical protein